MSPNFLDLVKHLGKGEKDHKTLCQTQCISITLGTEDVEKNSHIREDAKDKEKIERAIFLVQSS